MKALFFTLLASLFSVSDAATAAAELAFQKLGERGWTLVRESCAPDSFNEGKAKTMSFLEVALTCKDFQVELEVISPLRDKALEAYIAGETLKVEQTYSAGKNPYSGFISSTKQCPIEKNYSQIKFDYGGKIEPLLLGRLGGRRSWGGCGSGETDWWGALAFLEKGDALMKLRFRAIQKSSKTAFRVKVENFLRTIKAQKS